MVNLSEVTAPLRKLLKKNTYWHWKKEHTECFNRTKGILVSRQCLVFCDANKEVILQVDACKTGLGAALV